MQEVDGFDAFYAASQRRVHHALYAFTADVCETQDLVQEAYARCWQRWAQVGGYADPEGWVRTVALRLAMSRWRRARNAAVALRRHGPPEPMPPPSEDNVLLVQALRRISPTQRQAVVLHYLCGLSVDDIARDTDTPTGTVKARLSRGRIALAAVLGEDHTNATDLLEVRND